ncbi:hypothetical protein [Ramlibacter sp. Leaf400]|uniref:hypothetical protein n=1 Tax=Ramlibacter sp. Leaf400 TaxID=1736365 RepID=UPI0006F9CB84|nr:hypothetical protein [Ramlibacter sp. Leaf400]KQT13545.1 hypothetical protein ASG30_19145 [Ramlibacter sp. Leaf400]
MDRKDAKMYKILPALALGFALQTALADNLPAATAEAFSATGLMHATLVGPAQPIGAQRKTEQAVLKADADPAQDKKHESGRDHTTGMLLAALALMAGIVLRRWGNSQQ